MTQKRRKHQEELRRRKRILSVLFVIVVVLIGILAAECWIYFHKEKTAKVPVSYTGDQKLAETSGKAKTEVDKAEAEKKKADEEKEQRSQDFAVQTENVPGTSEQSEEKVVYLTIDDGPSNLTASVLDILDRYNAKATFFVTNANSDYNYMIKEAYDRGNTIGLHTNSHDYGAVYASVDSYFQDLDAIGQVVKDQIGYVPAFIRFPGGSSNTVSRKYCQGIMSQLVGEVNNRGYQYYDWNASSGDGSNISTEETVQNAISYDSNNIVLLCHDAAAKQTTIDALPAIIEHYQGLGYVFKAIDRNSFAPHHGVNN